jgi:hypothetical protein
VIVSYKAWVSRPPWPGANLLVPVFQDDPVCYLKKAFFLVQDIIDETMRFKDNTPNANATERLQELSNNLNSCFTKDYEEQNKVGWILGLEHQRRAEGGYRGPTLPHMLTEPEPY